jgi:translation elongation factor EF-Ts
VIKAYRDATGAGLKDAKDAVEALARERQRETGWRSPGMASRIRGRLGP